jgi:predicted RNase H-like nuclease (RuvC/YqgF family)
MPGEGRADPVGAPTAVGKSTVDSAVSEPGPEDLVSLTTTDGRRDQETVPAQADAARELDLRLREQTAENAKLDTELRYLQAELAVRKEYSRNLENELEAIHAQAHRHHELEAEYRAYRARISHRMADRLASTIHRRPWLSRPLKLVRRSVTAATSRAASRRSP